jgi:hypothetical protein
MPAVLQAPPICPKNFGPLGGPVAPTRNPARHAAPLPQVHEPPEATSLFVILIPIIAGQALHATRAPRAAHNPKFRSALLRRLFPHETLNRSRFPKLHSGPSNPAVTPLSERRQNLTDTPGARQSLKEKDHGTAHHQDPLRGDQATNPGPRHDGHEVNLTQWARNTPSTHPSRSCRPAPERP